MRLEQGLALSLAAMAWALLLASCGPSQNSIRLHESCRPLTHVREGRWLAPGAATVRVPVMYVHSLDEFRRQPRVHQDALVAHERYHAQRHLFYGEADYDRQFANSVTFRHIEEKAGWSKQIRFLVRYGESVNPYTVATFMATHYDRAFAFEPTLAWVAEEIRLARDGPAQDGN